MMYIDSIPYSLILRYLFRSISLKSLHFYFLLPV